MDIQDLLAAVDDLSPDDLARLKTQLAEREKALQLKRTAEEWRADLKSIAAEFRGEASDEEMRALIAAMNKKAHRSAGNYDFTCTYYSCRWVIKTAPH